MLCAAVGAEPGVLSLGVVCTFLFPPKSTCAVGPLSGGQDDELAVGALEPHVGMCCQRELRGRFRLALSLGLKRACVAWKCWEGWAR